MAPERRKLDESGVSASIRTRLRVKSVPGTSACD